MSTITRSENGWVARPDTSHFTRFTAAGQGWWAANDDVAVVFTEFIERFDQEVEEITQDVLDDWSYANRLVRGSTSVVSNHGSSTAIDLNATKHARKVHGTFTPAKAARMRAIKNSITDDAGRPVLRLGMDFRTVVDDMHVEVIGGERSVRQAADKIRARRAKEEDVKVEFTDDQLAKIGNAVLDADVELTDKAAAAIGGDAKPGQKVSFRYLLQWSPLVRRAAREDAARDAAEAARDAEQDQRIAAIQRAVDDLALTVGKLGRITTGGDPATFAKVVADLLAERMKS